MGIIELKDAFSVNTTNIDTLVTSLQAELQTAIVQDFTSKPKEKEAVELALNSLGTMATVEGLKEDMCPYGGNYCLEPHPCRPWPQGHGCFISACTQTLNSTRENFSLA